MPSELNKHGMTVCFRCITVYTTQMNNHSRINSYTFIWCINKPSTVAVPFQQCLLSTLTAMMLIVHACHYIKSLHRKMTVAVPFQHCLLYTLTATMCITDIKLIKTSQHNSAFYYDLTQCCITCKAYTRKLVTVTLLFQYCLLYTLTVMSLNVALPT